MDKTTRIKRDFLQVFIILVILETVTRFVICLSFTSDIYAFALAGIAIVFIAFYILTQRNAIKENYAVALVLTFYFLTHYAYVMGSYKYIHSMLLWFLIIPIATRIYFSNKITLLVTIFVLCSIIAMIYVSGILDVLHHYKEIVIDYYGSITGRFIVHIFYCMIALYNGFGIYYLVKLLLAKKTERNENKNITTENIVINDLESNNTTPTNSSPTITDVRLHDIFLKVKDYIETTECYLDSEYSMEQLSKDLLVHRVTLSQAFNKVGNVTFKDFLNLCRINKAKEIFLSDSFQESNIKETYLNVGFKYHTTFNRVFKKIEGTTPTEYIVNNRLTKQS